MRNRVARFAVLGLTRFSCWRDSRGLDPLAANSPRALPMSHSLRRPAVLPTSPCLQARSSPVAAAALLLAGLIPLSAGAQLLGSGGPVSWASTCLGRLLPALILLVLTIKYQSEPPKWVSPLSALW